MTEKRDRELLKLYRDIFAEITAKARPQCDDEGDPDKVTGYWLPVGPLHRAAGKTGFQMFDGERHLAEALRAIAQARIEEREAALEEAAKVADDIASIGHISPFWDDGQAKMFEDCAERIRNLKGDHLLSLDGGG